MSAAEDLSRIADMVTVLRTRQANVEAAERALAKAKSELRRVEEEDFPELMRECDLKQVTLADGTLLRMVDDVHCGISAERREAAHAWLREQGFGGIIKAALKVPFARGEEAEMRAAEDAIIAMGRSAERVEAVHPQTLKSFVREQREKGCSPPEEMFGITAFTKVISKEPKR